MGPSLTNIVNYDISILPDSVDVGRGMGWDNMKLMARRGRGFEKGRTPRLLTSFAGQSPHSPIAKGDDDLRLG